MEVILSQDVKSVGTLGEVVKVKDGFARNFLFPQNLAFVATAANLKKIEQQKQKRQEDEAKELGEAKELVAKLEKISCTVNVEVNDLDKLYGAISDVDIVKAIESEGFSVEKKQIIIEKPIEELGIFDVGVKIHSDLTAKVRLWVTKK